MKTHIPKKSDLERNWYLVDAKDKTLGHIATKIADRLRGKDKPIFSPHMDCGDFVIVINAEQIRVTGKKEEQKLYHRHSGYPGGYKSESLGKVRAKNPTDIIRHAVNGMIPGNKLRKNIMKKLKLYAGEEHPHEAQSPKPL